MDALIPHFEFGMLRLQHGRSSLGMRPVLELRLFVIGEHVVNAEALGPGKDQALLRPPEIIFDMALAADEGTHLLSRRHRVDVIVPDALLFLQRPQALDEGRARDAEMHGIGRVTNRDR
ncbi:hypothetical protein DNFV4_01909 [Nitrospira tepida]|uniref:Uncharacterized protein n=1 Tax=Nitrospira tepida TaxID=2973512 RepID=A0AA86MYX7_9BACT|nr:hypothetical protein DNFV4_01909 [Nitrospira tepida]